MPTRRSAPARSHRLRQVAQACALALVTTSAAAQSAATLEEVRVKAAADTPEALPAVAPGGKTAKGARLGVLGNTSVMDAPFNVTPFTAQTIEDQQARTLAAVLKNDPSVRTTTNEGHIVENFTIRGFAVSSSSMAINGLFGLAPEQSTPTEMFERVEVLKGPGAMLVGLPPSGDVGGVINLVPKRAGDTPLTRFTGTFWGDSNIGAHLDIARRVGDEQRLGVRFNGALSGGETWLDHQTQAREIGHVALDYRGRGWSAELDAYTLANKVRKGSPMQPVLNGWTTVPAAPDGSTNFFYGEDVYSNTKTQGVIVRGQAEINAQWTALASAGTANHRYDGFIFGTRPVFPAANAATGNATGTAYNSWGEYDTLAAEVGARGLFSTGRVAHRLAVTASLQKYEGGSRGNGTAPIVSNIYQPVPITMPAAADASTYRPLNDDVSHALSVVDTLSFADDRAQVTLGLRAQQVDQKLSSYKEEALTPLLGVVVKPWGEGVSLYGNYVEGLSAGTTVQPPYTNAGTTFEPYKTKQMELGVKWSSDRILHTLSLFQITKPALIVVDNQQRPDGEQRNRGIEWMVSGKVLPSVTMLGGAAYTKAEQTKTAGGVNEGRAQFGVPEVTANLGADWAVPMLPGLSLNGRVNYTSAQWLTGDNSVELPSWTTLDAGLRYQARVGEQFVTLRAGVTNLTDRAYFESMWGAGRVNVGAPRSVQLSASIDI